MVLRAQYFSILWRGKKKDKSTKAFYDWATAGIPVKREFLCILPKCLTACKIWRGGVKIFISQGVWFLQLQRLVLNMPGHLQLERNRVFFSIKVRSNYFRPCFYSLTFLFTNWPFRFKKSLRHCLHEGGGYLTYLGSPASMSTGLKVSK